MNCACGAPATITALGKNMCRKCFSIGASGTTDYRSKFPEPKKITEASICRCGRAARDRDPKANLQNITRGAGSPVNSAGRMYA